MQTRILLSNYTGQEKPYNLVIYIYIYIYDHNDFVATHALGHMMYNYTVLVPMTNEPKSPQQSK